MSKQYDKCINNLAKSIFQDLDLNMKLFSHLVIMGIDTTNEELTYEKIFNHSIDATIIDTYPNIDYDQLPRYLENYKLWCFPEGFRIYDEELKLINEDTLHESDNVIDGIHTKKNKKKINPYLINQEIENRDQLYHFIMTDDQRVKRYCSALLYYEQNYIKNDQKHTNKKKKLPITPKILTKDHINSRLLTDDNNNYDLIYIPKSISIVSILPVFEAQDKVLKYFYDNIIKIKRNKFINERIIKIPEQLFNLFDDLYKNRQNGESIGNNNDNGNTIKNDEYTNKSIDEQWDIIYETYCNTTNNNIYKTEKDGLKIPLSITNIANCKNITNTTTYTTPTSTNTISINKDIEIKETQLFEFYISVFFSLTPIDMASKEIVLLKPYKNGCDELLRYRINKTVGLNLIGYNYRTLFERLSTTNIVNIIKFIMLERRILFFSKNPGDIPDIAETLMTLISPMTWMCIFIPYLPISMVDVVESFMPYIIGMSKKYMKYVLANHDLNDVLIVDLDENKITLDNKISLPKKAKDYIIEKIDALLKPVKAAHPKKAESMWIDFTLKSRQLFNIFFLQIINNYINFFDFDKQEEGFHLSGNQVFKLNDYLKIFPKEDLPFMEIFCGQTMMFSRFLEDSYQLLFNCDIKHLEIWEDQTDEISQFIQILKHIITNQNLNQQYHKFKHNHPLYLNIINHNGNLKTAEILQNQQINEALSMYRNPEKLDILKYLVEYYYKYTYLNELNNNNNTTTPDNTQKPDQYQKINDTNIMNMNKTYQLLPRIIFDKIIDLNNIFIIPNDEFKMTISNNIIITPNQMNISSNSCNLTPLQLSLGNTHQEYQFNIHETPGKINKYLLSPPKIQCTNINPMFDSHSSMLSIPYEEPKIHTPTTLRKKNYFLYYQFVKRNAMVDLSPAQSCNKMLFDGNQKSAIKQQTMNMIHASFAWDKIATKINSDYINQIHEKSTERSNQIQSNDSYKNMDNESHNQTIINKNHTNRNDKEIWQIETEQDTENGEVKSNNSSKIFRSNYDNPKTLLEENSNFKASILSGNSSAHALKKKMRKESGHNQKYSVDYSKPHLKDLQCENSFKKEPIENGEISFEELCDKNPFLSTRNKSHNLNENSILNTNHANTNRKFIFEKFHLPTQNSKVYQLTPTNLINRFINHEENKVSTLNNSSLKKKRAARSCINSNRIILASSQFRGDQDENPELLMSPPENKTIKEAKNIKDVNIVPRNLVSQFDGHSYNQYTAPDASNSKGMPSLSNFAKGDRSHVNTNDMLIYAKNLDTGELVRIDELNKLKNRYNKKYDLSLNPENYNSK